MGKASLCYRPLAHSGEVNLLHDGVLEVRSHAPYSWEYVLTANSEADAEAWYDLFQVCKFCIVEAQPSWVSLHEVSTVCKHTCAVMSDSQETGLDARPVDSRGSRPVCILDVRSWSDLFQVCIVEAQVRSVPGLHRSQVRSLPGLHCGSPKKGADDH